MKAGLKSRPQAQAALMHDIPKKEREFRLMNVAASRLPGVPDVLTLPTATSAKGLQTVY